MRAASRPWCRMACRPFECICRDCRSCYHIFRLGSQGSQPGSCSCLSDPRECSLSTSSRYTARLQRHSCCRTLCNGWCNCRSTATAMCLEKLVPEDETGEREGEKSLQTGLSLPVLSGEQYDCTQSAARTGLMESNNANRATKPINEDANVRSMLASKCGRRVVE